MKNKRALAFAATLLLGASSLVACGGESHDYNLTLWCASNVKELMTKQANRWAESIKESYDVGIKVSAVSEQQAAGNMITSASDGADVYCFAQDQISRLKAAHALTAIVGGENISEITNNNDPESVNACKVGNELVAYPMTNDNGFFMYYDKSLFQDESKLENWDDIIEVCKESGRKIYFEMSGWQSASFFYGFGCHSEWTTDSNGKFKSYDDTYHYENGPGGLKACQAIYDVMHSGVWVNNSEASTAFSKNASGVINAAVLVSGTWSYKASLLGLGTENLGATDLPSATVNGDTEHLVSYKGAKLIGVKEHTDGTMSALSAALARYLTNEDCQRERFEEVGWGPSNKNLQKSDAVKNHVALKALAKQNEHSTPQGQYPLKWWDAADGLAEYLEKASDGSEASFKQALDEYLSAIDKLIEK